MIPKTIHYCWFGQNQIPKEFMEYIDSWRKYFPDYEIKKWDETNFDINCCDYVIEAYNAQKYAFVSDFARFKILYEEGGIYFDTDVEVIKSFEDILSNGGFMGRETMTDVNPGLGLATSPKSELLGELLEEYYSRHFLNNDGSFNLKTIVQYTTELLKKYGLTDDNRIQAIKDVYIYPKDYFNPTDMQTGRIKKTENTHSIHHYAASWESKTNVIRGKVFRMIASIFGIRVANGVRKIVGRHK